MHSFKPEVNLPGTVFLSVCPQATSSKQTSSIRALDATEMPGDSTVVEFEDMETTRSTTMVSKPTGVIARSQAEITPMRRQN